MNLYELRSDIKLLAEMLKLSKDTRFRDPHIDFMIREHRARGIREEYARNLWIDSTWLQDFGALTITPVNSADDPSINCTSLQLGKITLPTVVSLPGDKGVYRIAHSSKQKRYYYIDGDRFFSLVKGSVTAQFEYYFKWQNAFYVSPCADVNAVLILDDPMEGYVLLTEIVAQDSLTIGVGYTVYDNQIIHNSIAYNPGATFIAVNKNYSGTGYVKHTIQKRRMTDRDPYPMSQTLTEFVVMKIFTEDFQFSNQQVADIMADGQDELILQRNAKAQALAKSQESN